MLDYLREMDWFPRSARQHSTRLQQTYTRLENILGRARRKRRSRRTWGSPSTSFASSWRRSWDDRFLPRRASGRGRGIRRGVAARAVRGGDGRKPGRGAHPELKDVLGKAIDMLPEREQQLIAFYYQEDLTLREISRIFGWRAPRLPAPRAGGPAAEGEAQPSLP